MKSHVKYLSANLILKADEQLGPLVLGDCNSAMDKKVHKQFNIQTIISIGEQAMPIKQKLPQNCIHHFYDIHDNKSQKITPELFDQVNNLILEGRKKGGVLVHCYAGVSRSSTFVIAYIMQKFNKNFATTRQQVKKSRNCIYPNDGFVHHLKNYQKVLERREQERLRKLQEQKRLAMDGSIVKSARKSIRGAVRGADLSAQKAKQITQQRKKIVHQIIEVQQQSFQNSTQNLKNSKNYMNGLNQNSELIKSKSKQKNVSKIDKPKITQKNLKQTQKLNKQKQLKNTKINQNSKLNISKEKGLTQSRQKINLVNKPNQITKKIQVKQDKIKTQDQNKIQSKKQPLNSTRKQKDNKTKIENQQKKLKKQQTSKIQLKSQETLKSSDNSALKSGISVIRKPLISAGQQSLAKDLVLNQHDKKMKKIYQTKVNVM